MDAPTQELATQPLDGDVSVCSNVVLVNSATQREHALPDGPTLLGRGEAFDMHDPHVSRRHAEINVSRASKTISLVSLGTNPTYVTRFSDNKSYRMDRNAVLMLYSGDTIQILPDKFEFTLLANFGDSGSRSGDQERTTPVAVAYRQRAPRRSLKRFLTPMEIAKQAGVVPMSESPEPSMSLSETTPSGSGSVGELPMSPSAPWTPPKHVDHSPDLQSGPISLSELKLIKCVGRGSCGEVWVAECRGVKVAVKRVTRSLLTSNVLQEFEQEAGIMRKIRHPNVVLFMGTCVGADVLCIVAEYVSRGSLRSVLDDKSIAIPFPLVLKLAIGAAAGMNYLHNYRPHPIIHRDLKCCNLLVEDNWTVKVTDFGLAKEVTQVMNTFCGTWAYTAPEVFEAKGYTEKADVYSYGICMWEIYTRAQPYNGVMTPMDIVEVAQRGRRPDIPKNCPKPYAQLMQACWDHSPKKRPAFDKVSAALHTMEYQLLHVKPKVGPAAGPPVQPFPGARVAPTHVHLRPQDVVSRPRACAAATPQQPPQRIPVGGANGGAPGVGAGPPAAAGVTHTPTFMVLERSQSVDYIGMAADMDLASLQPTVHSIASFPSHDSDASVDTSAESVPNLAVPRNALPAQLDAAPMRRRARGEVQRQGKVRLREEASPATSGGEVTTGTTSTTAASRVTADDGTSMGAIPHPSAASGPTKRRRTRVDETNEDVTTATAAPATSTAAGPAVAGAPGWLVDESEVEFHEMIGQGAAAVTYRASFRGQPIAVKALRVHLRGDALKAFQNDLNDLSSVRCPRVAFFYGATLKKATCLLFEYMELGSLKDVMRDASFGLDWSRALDVAVDAARAINALHHWDPVILHGNLKSSNVLLDRRWGVKVADLGFAPAREDTTSEESCGLNGSWCYMAPELHDVNAAFSIETDAYAFGVLMWELSHRVVMGSHERPFGEYEHLTTGPQVLAAVAQKAIRPTKGMAFIPLEMRRLIEMAWSQDASNRPTFDTIVEGLCMMRDLHERAKRVVGEDAPQSPSVGTGATSTNGATTGSNRLRTSAGFVRAPSV